MAMAALRRSPAYLARLTGEPRNVSRKSSGDISAIEASGGFTSAGRGVNSGAVLMGARRFQGQTS